MDKQGFSLVEVLFSIGALGFGVALVSAGTNMTISQGKAAVTASEFQTATEDFKNSTVACELLIGQDLKNLDTTKIAAHFNSFKNIEVSHKSALLGTISGGQEYHDLELFVQAGTDLSSKQKRKIYAKADGTIEECSSNNLNIEINSAWKEAGLAVNLGASWNMAAAEIQVQICDNLLDGICDKNKGFGDIVAANEIAKGNLSGATPGNTTPTTKPAGTKLPDGTIIASPYGPAGTFPKTKPADDDQSNDSIGGSQVATGPGASGTAFGGSGSVAPKPGR
jgi:hypothetical protein